MKLSFSWLPLTAIVSVMICLAPSYTSAQCCEVRGDTDHSGGPPNLADVVYLADYIFGGGEVPQCADEADVNLDGYPGDISDIVMLADYIFHSGTSPADCDSCWVDIWFEPVFGSPASSVVWRAAPHINQVEIEFRYGEGVWGNLGIFFGNWGIIDLDPGSFLPDRVRACAVGYDSCCDEAWVW